MTERIFADSSAVRGYIVAEDPGAGEPSDSLVLAQTEVFTSALRLAAEDSLDAISRRGFGYRFGMTLPISSRLSIRTGLTQFGSLSEFMAGVTYYMKAVNPSGTGANPDGAIRSLVVGSDLIYDLTIGQIYLNLNLKLPVSGSYTVSAGVLSDLSGISRFGVTLKSYLKPF